MQVVDWDKSERGRQRRRTQDGRLLHCCCICGHLAPWGGDWSAFYSVKELDDELPVPKFCSKPCRERGGASAKNVTQEMKQKAKDAEWHEPKLVYREARSHEKYNAALGAQRRPATGETGEGNE